MRRVPVRKPAPGGDRRAVLAFPARRRGDILVAGYWTSASQFVEASSSSSSSAAAVFQLALVDTRNPTTGSSILQDVAASSGFLFDLPVVTVATIDFHPECDGRADVGIATGNYATSTGSSIALGFDDP